MIVNHGLVHEYKDVNISTLHNCFKGAKGDRYSTFPLFAGVWVAEAVTDNPEIDTSSSNKEAITSVCKLFDDQKNTTHMFGIPRSILIKKVGVVSNAPHRFFFFHSTEHLTNYFFYPVLFEDVWVLFMANWGRYAVQTFCKHMRARTHGSCLNSIIQYRNLLVNHLALLEDEPSRFNVQRVEQFSEGVVSAGSHPSFTAFEATFESYAATPIDCELFNEASPSRQDIWGFTTGDERTTESISSSDEEDGEKKTASASAMPFDSDENDFSNIAKDETASAGSTDYDDNDLSRAALVWCAHELFSSPSLEVNAIDDTPSPGVMADAPSRALCFPPIDEAAGLKDYTAIHTGVIGVYGKSGTGNTGASSSNTVTTAHVGSAVRSAEPWCTSAQAVVVLREGNPPDDNVCQRVSPAKMAFHVASASTFVAVGIETPNAQSVKHVSANIVEAALKLEACRTDVSFTSQRSSVVPDTKGSGLSGAACSRKEAHSGRVQTRRFSLRNRNKQKPEGILVPRTTFKAFNVPKDGNCMFNAVAWYAANPAEGFDYAVQPLQLRAKCSKWVLENWKDYQDMFQCLDHMENEASFKGLNSLEEKVHVYSSLLSENKGRKTWGDAITLTVLKQVLGYEHIFVWESYGLQLRLVNGLPDCNSLDENHDRNRFAHITRTLDHYSVLCPAELHIGKLLPGASKHCTLCNGNYDDDDNNLLVCSSDPSHIIHCACCGFVNRPRARSNWKCSDCATISKRVAFKKGPRQDKERGSSGTLEDGTALTDTPVLVAEVTAESSYDVRQKELCDDVTRHAEQVWRGHLDDSVQGLGHDSIVVAPHRNVLVGNKNAGITALAQLPALRNVTHVLSMLKMTVDPDIVKEYKPGKHETNTVSHIMCDIQDNMEGAGKIVRIDQKKKASGPELLLRIFQMIREVQNNPEFTLLIHCHKGRNRSWGIWVAYLLWENGHLNTTELAERAWDALVQRFSSVRAMGTGTIVTVCDRVQLGFARCLLASLTSLAEYEAKGDGVATYGGRSFQQNQLGG